MSFLFYLTIALGLGLFIAPWMRRLQLPSFLVFLWIGVIFGLSLDLHSNQHLWSQTLYFSACALLGVLGLQLRPEALLQLKTQDWINHTASFAVVSITSSIMSFLWLDLSLITCLIFGIATGFISSALIQYHIKSQQQQFSSLASSLVSQHRIQLCFILVIVLLSQILTAPLDLYKNLSQLMSLIIVFTGVMLFKYNVYPRLLRQLTQHTPELQSLAPLFLLTTTILSAYALELPIPLIALLSGIAVSGSLAKEQLSTLTQGIKQLSYALFFCVLAIYMTSYIQQDHIVYIVLLSFTIIGIKFLADFMIALRLKGNWLQQLQKSSYVMHGSEIGLVLLFFAYWQQMITAEHWAILSSTLILCMLLSPCWIYLGQKVLDKYTSNLTQTETPTAKVLIAGFGRMGQVLARVAHLQHVPFSVIDNNYDHVDFIEQYGGQFYSGDASDVHVLQKTKLEKLELFILAVDDIEDSMNTARYLTLNYPNLKILARARDRHHARLLHALGIEYVWRESHSSALDMAESMLNILGHQAQDATAHIHAFKSYDADLLQKQLNNEWNISPLSPLHHHLYELEHLFACDAEHKRQYTPTQETETETETETERIASR